MANHIVLVPQKLLKNPPSVREGLPHAVEQQQRIYGCHLIQKAGVLLKLEAVSIASAQTILHRFFFRRSLKQFDVRRVATASLLLACKLEEDPRRVMHLIGVIWLLSQLEDQPKVELKEETLDNFIIDFDSQEYELFRMDVFRCERYILRELGFMVSQTLVHPHRYILQYIHALFKDNFLFTNQLSQKAWGYLNDSMRTTLCCEVQPAVIAVGSIFLAACDLGIPLPRETGWYELFDVSWEDVMKVCSTILSLYTLPLPSYLKLADETRLVQKAPSSNNSSGAASSVRSAPATSNTSSKSRTTQTKEEMAKPVAAAESSTNRRESLNSRENCKIVGSSSSSSGRGHLTSRSSFAGKGDSGFANEKRSLGAAPAGYTEKRSPVLTEMATGDDFREMPQANQPGLHAEEMDNASAAAGDRGNGRGDILGKSAARVPRAQPRAPPPLKERSHSSVRLNQEVQATSGRAVSVSPSPGSSSSSSRNDIGGNSSGSRSVISSCSSSSGTSSGSSNSGANSSASGGEGLDAADKLSARRLKYIHFASSCVTPSADRTTTTSYSGVAGRRGSPCRKGSGDSEQRAQHKSSPSALPSNDRPSDRDEWLRGRQNRFELSRHGNSVSSRMSCALLEEKKRFWRFHFHMRRQAVPLTYEDILKRYAGSTPSKFLSAMWEHATLCQKPLSSLVPAGASALDKEATGVRKDENSCSRSSHWSGNISGNRTGAGTTSRGRLLDGLLGARESETAAGRTEVLRKGGENSVPSHGAPATSISQTRNSIPAFSRRERDDTSSHRGLSGGLSSPQRADSSHRLPRISRCGNTAAFLSSTYSANCVGAGCASSSGDPEGGAGSNIHHERRQRSPVWSLRCAESLEDAAADASNGEKRSVKRQRRPPTHS